MKAAYLGAALSIALASSASAMDAKVVGDQLVLSGPWSTVTSTRFAAHLRHRHRSAP